MLRGRTVGHSDQAGNACSLDDAFDQLDDAQPPGLQQLDFSVVAQSLARIDLTACDSHEKRFLARADTTPFPGQREMPPHSGDR